MKSVPSELSLSLSVFFCSPSVRLSVIILTVKPICSLYSRHPAGLQIYRIAVGGMVFFGSVAGLDIVWNLADLFMALMTLINLIALIFLGHLALKALKNYNDKNAGVQKPGIQSQRYPGNRRPTFRMEVVLSVNLILLLK